MTSDTQTLVVDASPKGLFEFLLEGGRLSILDG